MFRVVLAAFLFVGLAGCGLSTQPVSAGFSDANPTSGLGRRTEVAAPTVAKAKRRSAGKRVALARDRAPSGSFRRAQRGALSERDYSKTALDVERARKLINRYRRKKGLRPLRLNARLTMAAKAHSRDLAKHDRISHYGSDGSNPWDRVKRAGYNAKLAAENVGTGQASIEEVFRGWQTSPGHDKNLLLADAEHMGIALVRHNKSEFKTFWTLVIGAPL